jgi:GntR family transcriptional regulator
LVEALTDWGPDFLTVDKDSSIPIYVQIVDRVEALVTVGVMVAGDRLPSIRAVAERLRIDYNTVARAYTELDRAGVIRTARGIGTHVRGALSDDELQSARQAKLDETLTKDLHDLMALGFTLDEIRGAFDECLKAVTSN